MKTERTGYVPSIFLRRSSHDDAHVLVRDGAEHSADELASVGRECGLATGELVQEQELKKVLFLYRVGPTRAQRSCVRQWAQKNHLHLAIIEAVNWTDR